jgi:hypothetical protein
LFRYPTRDALTVILRRTEKLAALLPLREPVPDTSDTALGDWYVNRFVVDRQPLLLLVSAVSLLPMVVPARDVRTLPSRLGVMVRRRLQRFPLPDGCLDAEIAAMDTVCVAKTASRSILGVMNDFAQAVAFHLPIGGWDETSLPFLEERLAETPIFSSRRLSETVFPDKATPDRLRGMWAAG